MYGEALPRGVIFFSFYIIFITKKVIVWYTFHMPKVDTIHPFSLQWELLTRKKA